MTTESTPTQGKPRVVDVQTWRAALADQRRREKGRGVEQLSHTFSVDRHPALGSQEEWLDSPEGWPSRPTYSGWLTLRGLTEADTSGFCG